MTEAGAIAHVSDPASWDEICRRFPDQWLVLVEIDWSDERGDEVQTAFVAGCGASKREALAAARPLLGVFARIGCYHTAQSRVPALPPILYTTASGAAGAEATAPSRGVDAFAFA